MAARAPISLLKRALLAALLLGAMTGGAAAVDDTAILAKKPPRVLSAFGFFADASRQVPAEGVILFAPRTPLFTDFAEKRRFVYVPKGKSATYDAHEAFAFPVGAALIKTFAYEAADRPGGLRLVETRVLLRQEKGWQAWAYVWNEDQSEAELKIAGAKIPMDIPLPGGGMETITYAVPNKAQCKGCHALDGEVVPIGPKARNLNHVFAYPGAKENQLTHWASAGMLTGLPDLADVPAVPDWLDETAPLDKRARAWLDINCAHCHRAEGPASNSGLFLTWDEKEPAALGIGKHPVAAGRGAGNLKVDIEPGDPDASILVYRVESAEPGVMMPELGRSLTDSRAVALLREWVAQME
ncbi:SO2930 family diheme c-type cytochrome [Parvibaculum sp.]|uniref:SO2930 family diheme c-type cytochrome n=1 Tax=Parvibaculum sp. TaxID=2024848 RepID=UPI00391BF22D